MHLNCFYKHYNNKNQFNCYCNTKTWWQSYISQAYMDSKSIKRFILSRMTDNIQYCMVKSFLNFRRTQLHNRLPLRAHTLLHVTCLVTLPVGILQSGARDFIIMVSRSLTIFIAYQQPQVDFICNKQTVFQASVEKLTRLSRTLQETSQLTTIHQLHFTYFRLLLFTMEPIPSNQLIVPWHYHKEMH